MRSTGTEPLVVVMIAVEMQQERRGGIIWHYSVAETVA
jgi:hypothetical protein